MPDLSIARRLPRARLRHATSGGGSARPPTHLPSPLHLPAWSVPAGLRTVFRYHRAKTGVPAGHPHALRHSFGTALAEAGVDLAVLQALMGHDHVDSAAAYIHLSPAHVRAAYDAARDRQRAQ